MAIQFQGNSGVIGEVDGSTFRALRTTTRPTDHGSFGHFRLATTVPLVVTQAANGTLFSWRWGDATRFAALHKVRLSLIQTAAATATIMPSYQMFIARAFTASDAAGTVITLTGNNMKKRTNMATTLITDIRKSAVAAGLTAGARVLDAEPVMEMVTQSTITTPNSTRYESELEFDMGSGAHPYVFAQNEGFIIRGPTVVFGAAGTANLSVEVAWAELATF
jgi:hypothetical protein